MLTMGYQKCYLLTFDYLLFATKPAHGRIKRSIILRWKTLSLFKVHHSALLFDSALLYSLPDFPKDINKT